MSHPGHLHPARACPHLSRPADLRSLLMLASICPPSPLLLTSGFCPNPPGQILSFSVFLLYILLLCFLIRSLFLEGAVASLRRMVTIEVRLGMPHLLPPATPQAFSDSPSQTPFLWPPARPSSLCSPAQLAPLPAHRWVYPRAYLQTSLSPNPIHSSHPGPRWTCGVRQEAMWSIP